MAKLKADSDRGSIYSEALAEAVTAMAGLVTKSLASNKQAEEEAAESSFLFTYEGSKDNPEDKVARWQKHAPLQRRLEGQMEEPGETRQASQTGLIIRGPRLNLRLPSGGGQAEARSRQRSHHTIWAIFALLSQSHFCVLAWPTKELLMIPQPSEKPVLPFMFYDCSLHFLPSSSQKQ